ncbi:MAG: tetratricopeptide repeat protein [Epsilonproteobacteria bacterium]|nr:tetratricopeptide repeat protein [Campylobacterota bacterium]
MTIFQLLMLGASAFFAYKIYEHIQTLQDTQEKDESRSANDFSTFDATDLIQKADEALEQGHLDKALAIYSEANIKSPKNDEVLFKMGYTLAKQQRDDEALEYFDEALQEDANNPFTYLEMAKIYLRKDDKERAQNYLQKALALEPKLQEAKEFLEGVRA